MENNKYWDRDKYIVLKSKNKIAWLFTNGIYNIDIIEEKINNRFQLLFVFNKTEEAENCLQEFKENDWLALYLKSFYNVNYEIAKWREENRQFIKLFDN